MGENHFATAPSAVYGVVLLLAGIAYWILQQTIIKHEGAESVLKKAIGKDWKGKLSPTLYMLAIITTIWNAWIAQVIYVVVALIGWSPIGASSMH